MRFGHSFAAATLFFAIAGPAAAYSLSGSLSPGGDNFIQPLTFDHDGSVVVDIRFASASSFAIDSTSALYYLNLDYFDFYDPQTGEHHGGDDNFGTDEPFVTFGNDTTDTIAPYGFSFRIVYPKAQSRRDYVEQNPGDPFPNLIGYTETLLSVRAGVFDNAAPVSWTINVDGTAVVPEPATWALLIVGFGATGTVLRRRRTLTTVLN